MPRDIFVWKCELLYLSLDFKEGCKFCNFFLGICPLLNGYPFDFSNLLHAFDCKTEFFIVCYHIRLTTVQFIQPSVCLFLGFQPWERMFLQNVMVGMLLVSESCWRSKRKEKREWSGLALLIYLRRHSMNCWRFHRERYSRNSQ